MGRANRRFARIDESGRFRIDRIHSGRWELRLFVGDEEDARATVEATAGGPPVTIDIAAE